MLNPADGYVAEFTRAVTRAKVVRVATLMQAGEGADGPRIAADIRIAEAAARFADGIDALAVVDGAGAPIGTLRRADVVALMLKG